MPKREKDSVSRSFRFETRILDKLHELEEELGLPSANAVLSMLISEKWNQMFREKK